MKCFLDDDYEPSDASKAAFEAGRQAEIARANSPEEIAKWKQHAEELGLAIANGLKTIIK